MVRCPCATLKAPCAEFACRLLSEGKASVALSWLQRAAAIDGRNHIAWMLLCKCVIKSWWNRDISGIINSFTLYSGVK